MMLSATAFLNTITPAQAKEKATTVLNEEEELTIENAKTNTTGKIMMSESGFLMGGKPYYHILVWNSDTGKSKLYYFDIGTRKMAKTVYQLPSNPLP